MNGVATSDIPLLEGEHRFGQYQLQIARLTATGWVATVPPLTGTVTNCRLILKPQTRKPHPVASLPATYITKVSTVNLGQRNGVLIVLKVGYQLNIFVGWGQVDRFTADLTKMVTPSVRTRFIPNLPQDDLMRLIEAITRR
jgi:hypothetical protein